MEKNTETIINVETGGTKGEVLKRKLEAVKHIAVDSAMVQLQDARTFQLAAGVGLYQGLKYKGNFGNGFKAGVATVAVVTGVRVVTNLFNNLDIIKKA
jgi:hypothetical protein